MKHLIIKTYIIKGDGKLQHTTAIVLMRLEIHTRHQIQGDGKYYMACFYCKTRLIQTQKMMLLYQDILADFISHLVSFKQASYL